MSIFSEFKAFALRGNVVDLAVGIVIGGAFGKIVTALVDGLIMPFVGMIAGREKSLTESLNVDPFKFGMFLQTVIDFAIVAFAIFLLIKGMNALIKREAAAPAPPSAEVVLLTEIRDLLKKP